MQRIRRFAATTPFEVLEARRLMASTIDFLSTSGPVASVGDDPRIVITDDVNDDGKLDVITGNAQGLSVALASGSGFSLTTDVNLGRQVLAIAAADLNGDGKTDLLLNEIFGEYATLQGNGDGTFGPATPLVFDEDITPANVSLTDVNGDGRADFVGGVAVGNSGVIIRYNASTLGGAIAFDAEQIIPADNIDGDAVAQDLNGDGKPDLVGLGNEGVTVLLNTGNDAATGRATFGDPTTYATSFSFPDFLFVSDVTGDGKADVLPHYLNQDFDVLVNTGDGTFAAAVKQQQVVFNDGFADLNGDGKTDALGVSPVFGKKLAVALGNGDGTFQEPATLTLADVSFSGSTVADVNGDGKLDVLIADNDQDRVVILTGGASTPTNPGDPPAPPPVDQPDPGTDDPAPPDTEPAPAVDLAPTSPTGLGAQLVAGQKVRTSVTVTNSGDQSSSGPVTIKLYASADGVIDSSDTVLTSFSKNLKIAAKKAKAVALRFLVPSVGADASLRVLTEVSGGGDAGSSANNTAGADGATTINFVTPKLDVAATLGALPAIQAGKKTNVAVDLLNAGGADVKSPAVVRLFATTDGTLNGQEVELTSFNGTLNLKAGKAKKLKLKFSAPAELAGQTRTLVARVELPGDVQAGNDVAVGSAVTVS